MSRPDRYRDAHAKPRGPGDSRPTALQVIQDCNLTSAWPSKTVLITGVSSGIGVETAKALATTGATLYLTARNLSKARTALGPLAASPKVHLLELDLDSLASVRACAAEFLSLSSQLNILILNAGIRNTPLGHTPDGFERQFGVNHLSHFLLVHLLTPVLISSSSTPSAHSRVVALTSIDHRNFPTAPINWSDLNYTTTPTAYTPAKGYTQSKLANIYTATELNRRYAARGLTAVAVHPGGIATGLQQGENGSGVREVLTTPSLWPQLLTISRIMKSAEQGAATTVWAAVASELEGKGGLYLEDCRVGEKVKGGESRMGPGYGVAAFDEAAEKKLWQLSCEMVGVGDGAGAE